MAIISAEKGEILEIPQSSEVTERLPEPDNIKLPNSKVRSWEDRIEVARKIRDERLKNLNLLIDYYKGEQWHTDDNFTVLKDKTTVNYIFANIKSELPELYFQNPAPIVNARRSEFELNAFAMQELLKFYTKHNSEFSVELKKNVRLCILDAKFAYACIKVNYSPKFETNNNYLKPIIVGQTPDGEPIFLTTQDKLNILLDERREIITSDLYYVERVSPRELLIDPQCRNFPEKAKWIGHEIVKPLSYFKNNQLYKNTDQLNKNIELTEIFRKVLNKDSQIVSAISQLSGTDDTELLRIVEIHDFENKEILVIPDNYHEFIRQEVSNINPFQFLVFNEEPDEFGGVSDVSQEKPMQQEINTGRSLMITHARRSARKYAITPDTFRGIDDAEGMDALKDPDDMTIVKVSDITQTPIPIQAAAQDNSVFQNLIQSRVDFNIVSGSTEASRGVSERRKTKAESKFQEGHGLTRKTDKQSLIADFIVGVYTKLGKLMQATLTVPQAIKIIGPTGMFWSQVKRQDIQGELFYNIEVSDLRPQIPEIDRQEISEFIFALSNFLNSILANPVGPMIFNIQGLIKEFSKTYPSINVTNILNGQFTPEQIAQAAMMQLQQNNRGQNANL